MKRLLCAAVALVPLAALAADPPPKAEPPKTEKPKAEKKSEVPYKLSDTKHVVVRAKLNGKGPFNFILDTGAPAVFVSKAVAKKTGLEEDKEGWAAFDSFVLEGGLKVDKVKTRVADLYQLEGMNNMALAGVELHGVMGYALLARYRVTYDFTADKLTFVTLDFDPPAVKAAGKGNEAPGGLDALGNMSKMLAGFMGVKPNWEVKPGGTLGVEYEEKKEGLVLKSVFAGGPADKGGLKAGDLLVKVKTTDVDGVSDLNRALGKAGIGDKLAVTVKRDGAEKTLTVNLGGGL